MSHTFGATIPMPVALATYPFGLIKVQDQPSCVERTVEANWFGYISHFRIKTVSPTAISDDRINFGNTLSCPVITTNPCTIVPVFLSLYSQDLYPKDVYPQDLSLQNSYP